MKKIQTIALAGCSVLLLCQCASMDDVRRLNYQLRTMNQKVKEDCQLIRLKPVPQIAKSAAQVRGKSINQ